MEEDFAKKFYFDLYPYNSGEDAGNVTTEFLQAFIKILLAHIHDSNDRKCKVIEFKTPEELADIIDFEIRNEPTCLQKLLKESAKTLKYQIKTGHPYFFNQLSTGLDLISVAGEWLTATANSNMFTYEISPVFILMEKCVLNKMLTIVGFEGGDGVFCPGGTISNLYSFLLSRFAMNQETKVFGNYCSKSLVCFTSKHSHYSVKAAAAIIGIGTINCIEVPCDSRGKMIVQELEKRILSAKEKGKIPLIVNATAGTTVLGAFDSIIDIADVCKRYSIWLHVDGLLEECNQMCADYLFQRDKPYDVTYDTGDKAIQCGRRVDIFKLWLLWKGKGMFGFEEMIDKLWDLAKYCRDLVVEREGFYLINEPECTNVCFWYVPKSIRSMPECDVKKKLIGLVAPKIKAKMMQKGSIMIGYQPLFDKENFFRIVVSNPAVKLADITYAIQEVESLGEEVEVSIEMIQL